jgi:hypothetical protein
MQLSTPERFQNDLPDLDAKTHCHPHFLPLAVEVLFRTLFNARRCLVCTLQKVRGGKSRSNLKVDAELEELSVAHVAIMDTFATICIAGMQFLKHWLVLRDHV